MQLHVVSVLEGGLAREDAGHARIVGVFTDEALAKTVKALSGPCATTTSVELDAIPEGLRQHAQCLGIPLGA